MCFASVRHVVTPPAFINQQSSYPMKHHTSLSKMHRGFAVVSLAPLGVALSGCSGEPSAGDIDKTVRNLSQSQAQIQSFTGAKSSLGEIHDSRSWDANLTLMCPGCDVEVDITQFGNRTKGPASFRFVKGSDGWALGRRPRLILLRQASIL